MWKLLACSNGGLETEVGLPATIESYNEIKVVAAWGGNIFAEVTVPSSMLLQSKIQATGYAEYDNTNKNGVYARYTSTTSIAIWESTNDIWCYVYGR